MDNSSDIITALATMASAVAAFLAVKQTIKQRKISVTPQLVINNFQIRTRDIYDDVYSLLPISSEFYSEHRPEIINAGSGVALNASVTVEFDFTSKMKELIKSQRKINEKYNFSFENISTQHESKTKIEFIAPNDNFLKEAETIYNIGYVPPQSSKSSKTNLNLSPFFLEILVNEFMFLQKQYGDINNSINGPLFKIMYSDIDGNKYNTQYSSKLIIYDRTKHANKIAFKGVLEFKVIKNSWTQRRLQKIRKSYADFMDEHDFNKNR
ncbi:hypothetical protein GHT39_09520 [Citrobacter braakii]|uniref:hypothetical protein n=1 Tax=Citrobacter braakii TaxID=57706 RepID=UPI001906914A|nr:hypothetical protein [Citrobacter braakii]MBJ9225900.1 hypothetical protein [Citrobacter braakii]